MERTIENCQITLVEDQESLAEAAEWMSRCPIIAVDTESDSLFVYYEKVCLIQFSAANRHFIVDPLSVGRLTLLEPIFASHKIQKVFHAAEYDIMCLKRDYSFEFNNLFDTMIAARILGRKEFGLGALIEEQFGIHLEKRFQKSNWGLRPISDEMLTYATMDTQFLIELRNHLNEELKERSLQELAREDFVRLCNTPAGISEPLPINWWKAAGRTELTFLQSAALQALCEFRETVAQKRDIPPFKVVQNDVLLEIALKAPQTDVELNAIKKIPQGFLRRYGKSVLAVLEQSKAAHTLPRPCNGHRPSNAMLSRYDQLKEWRKKTAEKYEVPSDVILPKDVMEKIAVHYPLCAEQLAIDMVDCPWRFSHFYEEILQTLAPQEEQL